jgi:hypothetical protein
MKMFTQDLEVDERDDQIGEETTTSPPHAIPGEDADDSPVGAGRNNEAVAPPGNQPHPVATVGD